MQTQMYKSDLMKRASDRKKVEKKSEQQQQSQIESNTYRQRAENPQKQLKWQRRWRQLLQVQRIVKNPNFWPGEKITDIHTQHTYQKK